ncbi:translation machinery-associated protein 20 [Coniella lustricola]|uniref:Translation machinery-associated protein 20 n=1 Tax=Coniella lustricola TaxID=2025994 RepID=A0A2T2ZXW8_9PEZI|nr:translation machinery-associated protein 20 [Coniella lustricola]
MPLVVPGVTNQSGDKTEQWTNKLVGKQLHDGHESNETTDLDNHLQLFAKKELPESHRVIQPGQMVTKDFNPDRLNVHVKEDGTVSHVTHVSSRLQNSITSAPRSKLKSSVQRSLRGSLLSTYPLLEPVIDEVLPKKASLEQMKLPDRASLYVLDGEPVFFQHDGNTLLPHLKLVHRFPAAFPTVRIDRGAIRFVLSGATLMAPGLTSQGGRLPEPREVSEEDGGEGVDAEGHWSRELEKDEPVVIMAEGKEHACAVGLLVAGTKEVKDKGKGPVVEEAHFLGDGLWKLNLD